MNNYNEELEKNKNKLKEAEFFKNNSHLVKYIDEENSLDGLREMYLAIAEPALSINLSILINIFKQNESLKKFQVRLAALNAKIRANEYVFSRIAEQSTWEKQKALRLAAEKEYIMNNRYIFDVIADQPYEDEQYALMEAASYEIIRSNLTYFDLIAAQEHHLSQFEMMNAVLNSNLRENPDLLELIGQFKTNSSMQEQVRLNLSVEQIRNSGELFQIMCNVNDYVLQENLRQRIVAGEQVPVEPISNEGQELRFVKNRK